MNRWIASLAAIAALLALSCSGGGGGGGDNATSIADRVLRIGEGVGTEVEIFDGKVPDTLDTMLNPDDTTGDKTELPPLPNSKLIGSARVGRADGLQTFFVMYEVKSDEQAVSEAARGLFDETPWQIVGGQSSEGVTAYRFQNTRSVDLVGTVVVQPLPTTDTFAVTVSRSGKEKKLTLDRHAFTPVLGAELEDREGGAVVSKVGPGEGKNAGLEVGDRITQIGSEKVDSVKAVGDALRKLSETGDPVTSVIYIMQISAGEALASTFVLPEPRSVPRTFPAPFLLRQGSIPIAVEWTVETSGSAYQILTLSDESPTDVVEAYRKLLTDNKLQITSDDALGTGTTLEFTDGAGELIGSISIDSFSQDDAYTQATMQVQAAPGFSGTPTPATATPAGGAATPAATAPAASPTGTRAP